MNKPVAVVISASEIPAATAPGLERPAWARVAKDLIMPVTVPKKPNIGEMLAEVASTIKPRSRRALSKTAADSMFFSMSSRG
ncbi:hypothetical protein HRbin09_00789 [bacterium HR09]|nr:hypothetical protein HRbin09_00789 [bacterium HR09]